MTAEKLTEMRRRVEDICEQFAQASVSPPWELPYLRDSLIGCERWNACKNLSPEARAFNEKHTARLLNEFVPRAVAAMEKRLTNHQQIAAQKAQNVVATLTRLIEANKPIDVEQLTEMCRYLQA